MLPTIAHIDHLGAVDAEITPEERAHVEMLIQREMDQQRTAHLHPAPQEPVLGGVDMSLYTQEDNVDTALLYAQLQERNLHLWQENQVALREIQNKYIAQLESMKDDMERDNSKKRALLEQVADDRKRRQIEEYAPETEYLKNRWKDGIKGVVDESAAEATKKR